jgi:hypothetical protein
MHISDIQNGMHETYTIILLTGIYLYEIGEAYAGILVTSTDTFNSWSCPPNTTPLSGVTSP